MQLSSLHSLKDKLKTSAQLTCLAVMQSLVLQSFNHLVMQDYKFLTFARIPPPPPPPWVDAHGLLSQALQRYTQHFLPTLPVSQQEAVNAAVADLNLEWYIDLLSRLHINSFRYSKSLLSLLSKSLLYSMLSTSRSIAQGCRCMFDVAALHVLLCRLVLTAALSGVYSSAASIILLV